MSKIFNKPLAEIRAEEPQSILGANIVELESDMLTVKSEPKRILPALNNAPKDSPLRKHSYYETSSLRKIGPLYYFIYSSHNGHELCYVLPQRFGMTEKQETAVIEKNLLICCVKMTTSWQQGSPVYCICCLPCQITAILTLPTKRFCRSSAPAGCTRLRPEGLRFGSVGMPCGRNDADARRRVYRNGGKYTNTL